jgi:hypothetical protein
MSLEILGLEYIGDLALNDALGPLSMLQWLSADTASTLVNFGEEFAQNALSEAKGGIFSAGIEAAVKAADEAVWKLRWHRQQLAMIGDKSETYRGSYDLRDWVMETLKRWESTLKQRHKDDAVRYTNRHMLLDRKWPAVASKLVSVPSPSNVPPPRPSPGGGGTAPGSGDPLVAPPAPAPADGGGMSTKTMLMVGGGLAAAVAVFAMLPSGDAAEG